ncbi:MAG TPA: squalene/phytoene synthase family protein [Allosphingosinicella sp.]|uniref:squalene/phytoene synthase family protein n=1 Tax=Allosphingosinicella sp. TaxID=2823234 RepID=UPI002ED7FF9C
MTPLDPDRTLALSYVPARHRPAIEALWRLDAALGAVLAAGREPMISRIKLVWWRDALVKLDIDKAPSEPVLQALGERVLPRGVTGIELSAMEEGWAQLLTEGALEPDELHAYARQRGGVLFRLSARLIGGTATTQEELAGEVWALSDLGRHSGEPDASAAFEAARAIELPARWPTALRPIGMLAVLARRDAAGPPPEPQGSPGRMLRMLRHRITGR